MNLLIRLWGIRHLRYAVTRYKLLYWWEDNTGVRGHITGQDRFYLDEVWNGDA